jgi:hypothetical protein
MVLFLDKKEQVLEFELTPYGKHLFSVGKLDPKYYSFYDDDILYDSNYQTGTVDGAATAPLVLESQNSIVTRISDTQRIGSVTNFTEFLTNNSIGEVSVGLLADEFDQQMLENSNGIGPLKTDGNTQTRGKPIYMQKFQSPIGSNDVFKDYAPAWRVRSISGSKQFSDGYEYIFGQIPKLSASLDLGYVTTTVQSYDADSDSYVPRESYDLVKNDRLLLDIQELNSTFKQDENFDIEVFKLREGGENRIEKLHFINESSPVAGELDVQTDPTIFASRLQGTEEDLQSTFIQLDESFVEYFLSIRVDDEIDDPLPAGSPLYGQQRTVLPEDPC